MAHLFYFFTNMVFISLIAFGGGGQPLFEQFAVLHTHLISERDLSAILAFGYATPGPTVFGTATFIGYRVAGFAGAFVGSIGIFTATFLLSVVAAKYLMALLDNPPARYFVRGIGLAATGLLAATALQIAHQEPFHAITLFIIAGAFMAITRQKINPVYILLAGGLLGLIE